MPLSPLPIDPWLPRVSAELERSRTLVLEAEPGAGKTTRVPPWLAGLRGGPISRNATGPAAVESAPGDSPTPPDGEIWVLEPRRVAARAAAQRVASELGGRVGDTIGYQVRFDRRTSVATRVRFVTEGILTRRLLSDPALDGIAIVIFDEYHERSLEADLGLALTREVQATVRPDLRIVVMSATLESDELAAHLGGAPILRVPGRTHPIEIDHLERPDAPPLPIGVRLAFEHLLEDGLSGSVLVFVPGAAEIRACLRELEPTLRRSGYAGVLLHGDQPAEEQDRAISSHELRVVVSTNLAEASVTVQGVEAVIDSGRVRVARFDPWVGLDRLRTERISQASATQRAGRAGRLGPGRCVRLYTEDELARWAPFAEPEITRVDLSATVLALKGWGTRDLTSVAWPTPPPRESVRRAEALLTWLGAIEGALAADGTKPGVAVGGTVAGPGRAADASVGIDAGVGIGASVGIGATGARITELGRQMLRFPVPPRHARVLVEAERHGVARDAALWVALAGERDPRRPGDRPRRSDGPSKGRPERARGKVSRKTVAVTARGAATQGPSDREQRELAAESDLALLEEKVRRVAADRFSREALDREGLDGRTLRRITDVAQQLRRLVQRDDDGVSRGAPEVPATIPPAAQNLRGPDGTISMPRSEALRRAILAGHPDRVVRRHGRGSASGLMVGGAGVLLDNGSSVREADLFVALDATGREARPGDRAREEIRIWTASAIEQEWLVELFPGLCEETNEVSFLGAQERVRAARVSRFLDLVIDERETGDAPPEAIAEALVRAAAEDPTRALQPDRELEGLLDRLGTLARYRTELGVGSRDELLRSVLPPLAAGCRTLAELRRKPIRESLVGLLPPLVRKALDEDVPDRLVLASGQSFRVRYDGERPVLAVRLQELFGGRSAPILGSGRIPILLHLLAPSQRPVQITQDLDGFWDREYPKLRNELRRRYPKHAWPENPRAAAPSRPGRKR